MKKHLATMGLLIVSGAFIYFGASSAPSYAANSTDERVEITSYHQHQFNQDTVPGSDSSRHKSKGKNKQRKDTSWRNDSIPH
jgi:hypothetical protein